MAVTLEVYKIDGHDSLAIIFGDYGRRICGPKIMGAPPSVVFKLNKLEAKDIIKTLENALKDDCW